MSLQTLVNLIEVSGNTITPKPGVTISYAKIKTGYTTINIQGVQYALHKILVAFRDGVWPEYVDHIDRNRGNNAISNLRACNSNENNCNRGMRSDNTLGYKGIFKRELKNRTVYGWMIKYAGRAISQSGYKTPEEAYKARCEAVLIAHGEFANP